MRCKLPDCKVTATKTWALVPICEGHHETIEAETDKYYLARSNKPEHMVRPYYMQISHLIPWSKDGLGRDEKG